MTAELAMPITEDSERAAYWHEKAYGTPQENGLGGYTRTARFRDAQQAPGVKVSDFSLMQAHWGGTIGAGYR